MTTRNGRSAWHVCFTCCMLLLASPAAVRGEGSISFNGSSGGGTSKLQHTSANLLDGSDQMTICAWVYPDGLGEANTGVIAALDKDSSGIRIEHDAANKLAFRANWSITDGYWTFPVTDDAWNAVAFTYDKSATNKDPAARVDFATASRTQEDDPNGTAASVNNGYCIGNLADQTRTWEGRIAHVQVFNRILSAAEMDACLRAPGSVKHGLKLWLPMRNATDLADSSGNGFNGTATDLTTGSDSPVYDSLYQFGVVSETRGQLVIPSNGSEPAIGIFGIGTRSKLTANNSVLTSSTPFITNANVGSGGVIEPSVKNLYLHGSKGVANTPYGSASEESASAGPDAIALDGDAATVTGCKIFDFRGTGIYIRNSTAQSSPLIRMPRVERNKISHCWTGIRSSAVDTQVVGNRVANCRDYCLHITENEGNVQASEGNHYFGAKKAIYVVDAEGFHSTNDVFSDAEYGLHLTGSSHYSEVTAGFTQHCWVRNIDVESQFNSLVNCAVKAAESDDDHPGIVGVEFATRGNQFIGGYVYTSAYVFDDPTYQNVQAGATAFLFTNDGYGEFSGDNRVQTIVYSPTGAGGSSQDDICVRFADSSTGNQIEITIPYGFAHTDTRLLVIDSGKQSGMKYNKITFRGPDLGPAVSSPGAYVDIGSGGIDSTNTVTIIDSDTGNSFTLVPGTSY